MPASRSALLFPLVAAALAVAGAAAHTRDGQTPPAALGADVNAAFLAANARKSRVIETASGLQYKILKPGRGPNPGDADEVMVTYKGTLLDGRVFDQSVQPVRFPVARLIPGFTEGLKLMRKGARYRFWIKPELAYGAQSPDPSQLPDNALLIFDVQLVDLVVQDDGASETAPQQ